MRQTSNRNGHEWYPNVGLQKFQTGSAVLRVKDISFQLAIMWYQRWLHLRTFCPKRKDEKAAVVSASSLNKKSRFLPLWDLSNLFWDLPVEFLCFAQRLYFFSNNPVRVRGGPVIHTVPVTFMGSPEGAPRVSSTV